MSSLKSLEALGCYVNAGHLDHYDGRKHTRLGDVTADGEVVFTDAGRAYADELAASVALEVVPEDAAPAPTKRGARAKPAPEPLDPDLQALAED